ncbi:MAG: hypothetical protein KatS3mg105_3579 [Gemmatales bacterium]|nr:MAG: hypothetical protein KatS3mg105_3579 [Gemmatales bacterium]
MKRFSFVLGITVASMLVLAVSPAWAHDPRPCRVYPPAYRSYYRVVQPVPVYPRVVYQYPVPVPYYGTVVQPAYPPPPVVYYDVPRFSIGFQGRNFSFYYSR